MSKYPAGGFNCYWEMPFRNSALLTIENIGDEAVAVYYQINYTLTPVLEDTAYFSAQFLTQ
jgi:hypothetical protein